MKKIMMTLAVCAVLAAIFSSAGCAGNETFEAKHFSSGEAAVSSLTVDATDREIEISPSQDGQIHIEYSESASQYYEIGLSEQGELTMTLKKDRAWTDLIEVKPDEAYRKIKISLPNGVISDLSIKTTNEAIRLSPLSVRGGIRLDVNGGDLIFDALGVGERLELTAKDGDIVGSVRGGWDDFSISCNTKKGECNLPERKEGGEKSLQVNCNNGDIDISFVAVA